MRRIDRYLLGQLLAVFAFFSLVLVAVYWVNRAARLFDALIGDGQTFWVFLELSALTLPNVIRVVLPVSAFAAAAYVAARLTRDNEMAVLQGAGQSPGRLMVPVVLFGLIVALMLGALMHVLVPLSRTQLTLRQAEIAENITSRFLRAGEFLEPASGIVVFVTEVTPDGQLEGVFLSDTRDRARHVTYSANSALLVPGEMGPRLVMLDGVALVYTLENNRLAIVNFDDLGYDLSALVGPAGRSQDVREFPTRALIWPDPDVVAETGVGLAELRYELASRVAHPLLAVITSLIGFAAILLGQFSRFGVWRQVLGAIVALAVIQLLNNLVAGMALRDVALAWVAFVPVILGAALVAGMLGWASRRRRPFAAMAAPGGAR